eukprot:SAG22_NODE_6807_length_809_cov_1.080282_1_plen_178_part_01
MSDSEDDYNEEWQENSSDSEDSDEDWDDGGPAKKKAKGRGATKKGKGSAAAEEEQPARRKGKAKPKELTKVQKEVRETADRLKRAAERNGILGRMSSAGQPTDVPQGSPRRSVAYRPPSPAERACVRAAMLLEQCNVVRRNANKQIKVRPGAAPLRRFACAGAELTRRSARSSFSRCR